MGGADIMFLGVERAADRAAAALLSVWDTGLCFVFSGKSVCMQKSAISAQIGSTGIGKKFI